MGPVIATDVVLLDVYRLVLLAVILVVLLMYSWSLRKYASSAYDADNALLRDMRIGQGARVLAVWLMMLLLGLAILERLGSGDNGRVLSNVVVQILCLAAIVAWLRVDVPRFRAPGSDAELRARLAQLEAVEIAARRRVRLGEEELEALADHGEKVAESERRRVKRDRAPG